MANILLIDDDEELCSELSDILESEGYNIDKTTDSKDGEKMIENKNYDLYLLDYKMSGLTGIELLKKIKSNKQDAVVFIISGRPSLTQLLENEKVSNLVKYIISKPFDIDTLLSKIKNSLI